MDHLKLARFCELKVLLSKLEDELDALREEIIEAFPEDAEIPTGHHTLKVIYQEKKQYNEQALFDTLPDLELWKHVSKVDTAKISLLLKANVLSERLLDGTYRVVRRLYLYVHSLCGYRGSNCMVACLPLSWIPVVGRPRLREIIDE